MTGEIIHSERLQIRRWREADIPRLFTMYADAEVTRFLPELAVSSLDEIRARHPHLMATSTRYGQGYGAWAAARLDSGLVVGLVLLKPLPDLSGQPSQDIEVGWHLARDSWGKGYATEMGAAALRHGFQRQGLEHISAIAHPENTASFAVMQRLGMTEVGPNTAYYEGAPGSVYRITARQWRTPSAQHMPAERSAAQRAAAPQSRSPADSAGT